MVAIIQGRELSRRVGGAIVITRRQQFVPDWEVSEPGVVACWRWSASGASLVDDRLIGGSYEWYSGYLNNLKLRIVGWRFSPMGREYWG